MILAMSLFALEVTNIVRIRLHPNAHLIWLGTSNAYDDECDRPGQHESDERSKRSY